MTDAGVRVTSRRTFLLMSDFDRLEDWCRMVRVIFGPVFGPYLVGSATKRSDYRDVDIRVLIEDRRFAALFRERPEAVRFVNRAFSIWGQQETGLPIDFQVQQQTEANERFPEPRNAMGVRDWSIIPTSGVPTPGGLGGPVRQGPLRMTGPSRGGDPR